MTKLKPFFCFWDYDVQFCVLPRGANACSQYMYLFMEKVGEKCDNLQLSGHGTLLKVHSQLHESATLLDKGQLRPRVASKESTQSKQASSLDQLWLPRPDEPTQ